MQPAGVSKSLTRSGDRQVDCDENDVLHRADRLRQMSGLRAIIAFVLESARELTLIAKSSKHENAKQPHWAQARSSCWGTRSPPL